MRPYRYTNLTTALRDTRSPLRAYLGRRFPQHAALQAEQRADPRALLVDSAGADAATLGTAFDIAVRFLLDPAVAPETAMIGFGDQPSALTTIAAVIDVAAAAARSGPAGAERLDRACWALALTTEVYRVGLTARSPLRPLLATRRFGPGELLALAPADALRQLRDLRALAEKGLFPHLSPPYVLGPTFDGSRLCAADADLIADRLLVDIKTRLGPKNPRTGARADRLQKSDVQQLLGYVLFDTTDRYRIDAVGIYSARYGRLTTWPLPELLDRLAGEPVDLAAERREVWRLLGGR